MTSATDGVLTLTGWLTDAEKDTLSDANTTNPTLAAVSQSIHRGLELRSGSDSTEVHYLRRCRTTAARVRYDGALSQHPAATGVASGSRSTPRSARHDFGRRSARVVDKLLEAATVNGRSAKDRLVRTPISCARTQGAQSTGTTGRISSTRWSCSARLRPLARPSPSSPSSGIGCWTARSPS